MKKPWLENATTLCSEVIQKERVGGGRNERRSREKEIETEKVREQV